MGQTKCATCEHGRWVVPDTLTFYIDKLEDLMEDKNDKE